MTILKTIIINYKTSLKNTNNIKMHSPFNLETSIIKSQILTYIMSLLMRVQWSRIDREAVIL